MTQTAQRPRHRALPLLTMLSTLLGLVIVGGAGPARADSFVPISGAGSTWSSNAIDQWRRNVNQYGLTVNYASSGSSDGRNQFRNGTVDFGVSEIPFGLKDAAGVVDTPPQRKFAYMPIVAGGTAFMYNLKIGGQRVTNLRLSGDNITKIFTGVLTQWNDPLIAADNPGLTLPARKIVPVVRSDGSGTSAQFTLWMSKQYGGLWNDYCAKVGLQSPCGQTSDYPSGTGFVAQAGSLGVAGYVSQAQNEGTITYVEYSYALNTGYPVAKLLNRAGYYSEPTASNVAVALLGAQVDPNDLTQQLDGTYNSSDPRTYPLSSYSYMVIPTAAEGSFSTDKGNSLGSFAQYFLCEGQQQAPVLGYSPLPINLVKAGLDQVKKIPGVTVENIDISKCNNPTFSASGENTLAKTAPQPADCDKQGPSQCSVGSGGARQATVVKPAAAAAGTGATTATSGGPPAAAAGGTTKAATTARGAPTKATTTTSKNGTVSTTTDGTTATGTAPGVVARPPGVAASGTTVAADGTVTAADGTTTAGVADASGAIVNPDTGEVVAAGDGTAAVDPALAAGAAAVTAVPTTLASNGMGGASQGVLTLLVVLLLLAAVVVPPLMSRRLTGRARS